MRFDFHNIHCHISILAGLLPALVINYTIIAF